MPLTLRLIFHSLRSAWVATLLALTAWVGLASATPEERAALGAQIGTERPAGLVQMRIARAMVHFAPDRAARMLSDASQGRISPELAGMLLRDLASGPASAADPGPRPVANGGPDRPDGAKFVRPGN